MAFHSGPEEIDFYTLESTFYIDIQSLSGSALKEIKLIKKKKKLEWQQQIPNAPEVVLQKVGL